jgi:hypothetical protein
VESLRRELQSVCGERDSYQQERDLATHQLAEKEPLLARRRAMSLATACAGCSNTSSWYGVRFPRSAAAACTR